MITLSEIQHDALVEIFNISIGRAAAAMSSIVNEEITLAVPTFRFMTVRAAAEELSAEEGRRICGVAQSYRGTFDAEAILMFPEERSLEIVRMMVGEAFPLDALSELEQEAMSEIGNIILNACFGTIANIVGGKFTSTLPAFRIGTSGEILHADEKGADDFVLFIFIDFIMEKREIHGYVAFLMNVPSIAGLLHSIDRFIGKIP
ncbi:MAG: chemotaxis protein CheC [Sulfuricellaceae bacterium]|jgi:chemotaxis protein CheC